MLLNQGWWKELCEILKYNGISHCSLGRFQMIVYELVSVWSMKSSKAIVYV